MSDLKTVHALADKARRAWAINPPSIGVLSEEMRAIDVGLRALIEQMQRTPALEAALPPMPTPPPWGFTVDHMREYVLADRRQRAATPVPETAGQPWRTVAHDGFPECDGYTTYIGINSAGYACCFNAMRGGMCVMETPEGTYRQMSDLQDYRLLDRPARAVLKADRERLKTDVDPVARSGDDLPAQTGGEAQ